jgi:hypothetical protein
MGCWIKVNGEDEQYESLILSHLMEGDPDPHSYAFSDTSCHILHFFF